MKTSILFVISFFFINLAIAQNNCSQPKEDFIDLNSISISKCDVKKNNDDKKTPRRVIRTATSTRKRISKSLDATGRSIQTNMNITDNSDNTLAVNERSIKFNKLAVKTVLFNLVDASPTFPECETMTDKNKIKNCFQKNIQDHFTKNFDPESIMEDNLKGKVIVRFNISIDGSIDNIAVQSRKKSKNLNKEIVKILTKLPNLSPGKLNGLPVNVTYVFPFNLTTDE